MVRLDKSKTDAPIPGLTVSEWLPSIHTALFHGVVVFGRFALSTSCMFFLNLLICNAKRKFAQVTVDWFLYPPIPSPPPTTLYIYMSNNRPQNEYIQYNMISWEVFNGTGKGLVPRSSNLLVWSLNLVQVPCPEPENSCAISWRRLQRSINQWYDWRWTTTSAACHSWWPSVHCCSKLCFAPYTVCLWEKKRASGQFWAVITIFS